MIKVILADDHPVVLDGIKSLLHTTEKFEVVATASDGRAVLDALDRGTQADLILTDMNMPGLDGFGLAEAIAARQEAIKTVILTIYDQEAYMAKAFEKGAHGFLNKNIDGDELIFALQRIHQEKPYICQHMSRHLFDRVLQRPIHKKEPAVEFSKRELEVLHLIAEGLTNKEIADKLFTSRRTVEGHRLSLINKTGARNTPSLIKYAVLNGVIAE